MMPLAAARAATSKGTITYLTPGLDIQYWRYLSNGVEGVVKAAGYDYVALSSDRSSEIQLNNAKNAIARGSVGIVLSPTDTTTAPAVLGVAARSHVPVVIGDIGTTSGEYLSFVITDNFKGAYALGKVLAKEMIAKGWKDGSVGIIAISQARKNGQARTAGFRKAMQEAGITHSAGLQQMETYTAEETFKFVQDMLTANPNLRGLFIETANPLMGAVRALKAARREVLIAGFDGTPETMKLIESGKIIGTGIQQPYRMGVDSGRLLVEHLAGKEVPKKVVLQVLVVTTENVHKMLPIVEKDV
ncbi:MAG: substrate-binding domain-containing protein, partial [Acetobacteraceae bacterium]